MGVMRSYALALVSLLAALTGSGCTNDNDYQLAVSWLINGTTPNADLCAEQGVAKARFEVRSGGGRQLKTVEANCADTVILSDREKYGGFLTSRAFTWDVDYYFTLTLVDAAGKPVSIPAEGGPINVGFDEAEIHELGYLDYIQPKGNFAPLAADWTVLGDRLDTVAADCAAAGIDKVRIMAASALDQDLLDAVAVAESPCATGKFQSAGAILARGFYFIWLEAVGPLGNVVESAHEQAQEFLVNGPEPVLVTRVRFR